MPNLYRIDGWVKAVQGMAIAGAQVYICSPQPADTTYIPPEPLANAWSDPQGVSPITFPIFSDGFGHYDAYLLPGVYTLVIVNNGFVQAVYADQSVGNVGSGITPSGGVSSFIGRTGDILALSGDYAAFYDPLGAAAAAVVGLAPLASPGFTGVPTAPTAPLATNTNQIATTAFVLANAGAGTVFSVFSRAGNVLAQSGDYSVAQVTGAAPLASPSFSGTAQFVNAGITGTFADGTTSVGTPGQLMSSTGTGIAWVTTSTGGNKITIGTNASFKATPPASPSAGDEFVCTDSSFSYVYTGAAWQAYFQSTPVVEPTAALTTINAASATVDYSKGGMLITVPQGTSSYGLFAVVKPVLVGAYYIDVAFSAIQPQNNGGGGIGITDGTATSNKAVYMKWGYEGSSAPQMERQGATNFTTFSSNSSVSIPTSLLQFNSQFIISPEMIWMRIYDDGTTNRTFYFSYNGLAWVQIFQESRTDFLTPTQAALVLGNYLTDAASYYYLVHFSVHT